MEAAKRKKSADILAEPISRLDIQLGRLFAQQGRALVRALSPLRNLFKEAAITKQFDALFDDATQNTSAEMLGTLEKAYKSALMLGGANQLTEVGVKISFTLDNPRARAYIAAYGADQISTIDDNTRADLRNLLTAAIENGQSYTQLAAAIKARYKRYAEGDPRAGVRSRARLIAVTEIGNGYQAGNFASMQATQDAGIKIEKRWLTVGDTHVSDGCRTNQAQGWIALVQVHTSGHLHPLRFPGCRCVEQYQRVAGTAQTPNIAKPAKPPKVETPTKIVTPYAFSETNARDIHNALEELFPNTTSFWDKQLRDADMNAVGLYEPGTGKLFLSTRYGSKARQDEKYRALIHELLHSRSKGTRDFNLEGLGWEEAIVEGNAQLHAATIAKTVGYTFVDEKQFESDLKRHPYYDRWIKPLNDALDELGLEKKKFYTDMLSKTCDERKAYLRAAYRKKYPKGNDARDKLLALNKVLQ